MSQARATLIRKSRVIRMEDDCAPTIAIGFEDRNGEQWYFALADADAYDLIRRMHRALFDVDPPRSGVGSPEDASRSVQSASHPHADRGGS